MASVRNSGSPLTTNEQVIYSGFCFYDKQTGMMDIPSASISSSWQGVRYIFIWDFGNQSPETITGRMSCVGYLTLALPPPRRTEVPPPPPPPPTPPTPTPPPMVFNTDYTYSLLPNTFSELFDFNRFYIEPLNIIRATGNFPADVNGTEESYISAYHTAPSRPEIYGARGTIPWGENYIVEPNANLHADLSAYTAKIKFNLFEKSISSSFDGYSTTTTSIDLYKYPRSVYLKSVELVKDSLNRNGYASIDLVEPVLLNRCVYSVDVEGEPTTCKTGYVINLNVTTNDVYCPNMAVKYTFIDTSGTEFSYISDDPLVEIDTFTLKNLLHIKAPVLLDLEGTSVPYWLYHYTHVNWGGSYLSNLVYVG